MNRPAGNVFTLVLLAKPSVDVLWEYGISIGGFRLSPLTVSGFAILLYFSAYIARQGVHRVPVSGLLIVFLGMNCLGFALGALSGEPVTLPGSVDFFFRLGASFALYISAYQLALKNPDFTFERVLRFSFVGLSVAVVLNVVGIWAGFGGAKEGAAALLTHTGDGVYREAGLYYDPGVLAVVCLNALILGMALLASGRIRGAPSRVLVVVILVFALSLIFKAVSRAAILLATIDVFVFTVVYARGRVRLLAFGSIVVLLPAALILAGINDVVLSNRFESELSTIERLLGGSGDSGSGVSRTYVDGDEGSLDSLEGLGNNRGMLWRQALADFGARDALTMLFGNGLSLGGHSDYIDVLGRTGVFGLIVYLLILSNLLWRTMRRFFRYRGSADNICWFVAMLFVINYALYAFPFRPLLYTTPVWYMWIFAGIAFGRTERRRRAQHPSPLALKSS